MLLYRILISFLAPLILFALFLRVLRRQETIADFGERCGFWRASPKGNTIWIHGASNGELTAARPVIEGIEARAKDTYLLITCNSISGKTMLQTWDLSNAQIRLAPIDLRWVYRRLMSRLNVQHVILIEADFWPNRILAAKAAKSRLSLIAGRMSKKSTAGWQRFGSLASRVFPAFDLICAQDETSEQRLSSLGARANAIGPRLAPKSLVSGLSVSKPHSERAMFWLAASTHEGEDEALLKAHQIARETLPELRMILAPRHPKRAKQILQIARRMGLSVAQRSNGEALDQARDIYLADTLGEMALWYSAAGTCFVAGSLVDKGGHTPFEPAVHDCAILHGPHLENFAENYDALGAQAGALLCSTPDQIADALIALQEESLASIMRSNARRVLSDAPDLGAVLDALIPSEKTN